MILKFEDLKDHRGRVAMVDGAFDPLHHGHIAYFRQARELGVPLLCNIAPDRYVTEKHPPLLAAPQRAIVIDALADIAYTHLSQSDTETVLGQLRPTHYIKGMDWEGRLPPEQRRICAEQGTEIVLLQTVLDSSTELLRKFRWPERVSHGEDEIGSFELLVFDQHPVDSAHRAAECFVRDEGGGGGGSDHAIEDSSQYDGRHLEVIKDVFRPERVLDAGCGTGALLFLLQEQGILADGLDFRPSCRELAPAEIRDRIRIGTKADPDRFADNSYDVVICRDILEHLTVLQITEAVRHLCRVSSRFVYVTARFHPDPAGLLDVATQRDVGRSPITLLNQNFLRVLIVLEGFRRRPDLETAIDLMGTGRVLVYEKPETLE